MYNAPHMYQYPHHTNALIYDVYNRYKCPYFANTPMYNPDLWNHYLNQYFSCINHFKTNTQIMLKDYGPNPFVVDIEEATKQNNNFRLALWTGKHLQLTLMSINVGEDIGLEVHQLDQFIRIEEGQGLLMMGDIKDRLDFQACVRNDYAFIIPAGVWHNLINTGNTPLKIYSIYAPPQHPFGTVHETKEDEK